MTQINVLIQIICFVNITSVYNEIFYSFDRQISGPVMWLCIIDWWFVRRSLVPYKVMLISMFTQNNSTNLGAANMKHNKYVTNSFETNKHTKNYLNPASCVLRNVLGVSE